MVKIFCFSIGSIDFALKTKSSRLTAAVPIDQILQKVTLMSDPSYPIYAMGDVHGHLAQLEAALIAIEKDGGKDAAVVFIGDLVDRGPDSRRVIELLISLCAEGRNFAILKVNHDRMFEWFMQSPPRHDPRLYVGLHWFHDRLGGVKQWRHTG